MPLYEYQCEKCGKHFERIEKVDGPHLKKCPSCGGRVERLMSPPAIQFKGSGWYVTDYARGGTEKTESGAKDKSEGKTEPKTDSKPETKTASESKAKKKVSEEK